jgi:uncharacterized protein YdhG (YjbR/CyaY superfamily)
MQSKAESPKAYIEQLPEDRKSAISKVRSVILENMPNGFEEVMSYGMIGFVVPHSIYPSGYHCTPDLPLPFMSLASQKNFIALYHMGMYADKATLDWFVSEYPNHCKRKLDMGKSCIRFKYLDDIPFDLIGQLASKMTPQQWIELYESAFRK